MAREGAQGRLGHGLMGPLLVVDLVVYLIMLGLASWSLDKYIDGQQSHPHLGGNSATNYLLMAAMLAGTTGTVSMITGFAHARAWSTESMAAASSSAAISWAITAFAFGITWKEIKLGGRRGKRLQTLEIFIIISTLIHFLYILLLHAGHFNSKYGPSYGRYGPEHIVQGPSREDQKGRVNDPDRPNT